MKALPLKSILAAFRPKTLTAAFVPCIAATCLAFAHSREFGWINLIWALLSATCIQIGTNLVNDAMDFKKGADTDERLGPQRITQAGILSSKKVFLLGTFFFVLAIFFGLPLVLHGGWPLVVIGLVSVGMGYGYTAGPYPLAYLGLGDLFVVLFFGLIAVGGMYFVQTEKWTFEAFILGLQIGMLATVLIAINNLRDIDGDRQAGKKTMAVRFGATFSKKEIAFLVYTPFILNLYWMVQGYWIAGLLPLLTWPVAFRLVQQINRTEPGRVYNQYLAQAAVLHLSFGLILGMSLLW